VLQIKALLSPLGTFTQTAPGRFYLIV